MYIHLEQVQLNKARVKQRVTEGGHDVPAQKIESRIPRTMASVKVAIPLCDWVYILENSSADEPFVQVAEMHGGQFTVHLESVPEWFASLQP